jgi:hypothetical protein
MGFLARLGIIVLVLSSLAVLFGLLLGQVIETEAVTDTYTLEHKSYRLQIRDGQRDFRINLVGTRCYEPLPPWAEEDTDNPSASLSGQFSQTRFNQPQEAVITIKC